jgi:hypothetical protein
MLLPVAVFAQLRVATWNITVYSGGRTQAFQTALYGEFEGRRLAPDVLTVQEILSQSAVNEFLALLNAAPGSPGDWAAATFVNGPDTDSACFYRTSKLTLLATFIAASGGTSSTNQPRNTMRYDFRLKGYSGEHATFSYYSVHMKAGTSSTDQQRRLVEATNIADDIASLPAARGKIVGGDLNIQNSNQQAYQHLTRSQNNFGPVIDPIATPGSWDNNSAFRFVHTQDPISQMDSRYDQILLSPNLYDGQGLDYIGQQNVVFSTSTWNDPNHSYRCWGNDGTTYNVPIKTTGNSMVGPIIAQALKDSVTTSGHLPVLLELIAPAKMRLSNNELMFGKMSLGETRQIYLDVYDVGNRTAFGFAGVRPLQPSFSTPTEVQVDGGTRIPFERGYPTRYWFSYTATSSGTKTGTVTLNSNDPEQPTVELPYTAIVSPSS